MTKTRNRMMSKVDMGFGEEAEASKGRRVLNIGLGGIFILRLTGLPDQPSFGARSLKEAVRGGHQGFVGSIVLKKTASA